MNDGFVTVLVAQIHRPHHQLRRSQLWAIPCCRETWISQFTSKNICIKLWRCSSFLLMPNQVLLWSVFGATHLARLLGLFLFVLLFNFCFHIYFFLVKLPDFLNKTPMSDGKLKLVLKNLSSFAVYLESHKEWFGEQNYQTERKKSNAGNWRILFFFL